MQGSRANNLLAIIAFNQEGFMLYCMDISITTRVYSRWFRRASRRLRCD